MHASTVTLAAIAAVAVSAQQYQPPAGLLAERDIIPRKGDASGSGAKAGNGTASASAKATSSAAASKTAKGGASATASKGAGASKSAGASSTPVPGAAGPGSGAMLSNAGGLITIAGLGVGFALFM